MEILLQFMYGAIVDLPRRASARYCMYRKLTEIKLRTKKRC